MTLRGGAWLAAGALWLVVATLPAWPLWPVEPAPPARPAPAAEEVGLAESVALVDVTADGRLVHLEVGEVVRRTGRRGFLRSPLLEGDALRDLRVWIDGELVAERAELVLPRIGRPGREPLAAFRIEDLESLVGGLLGATR